MAEKACHVFGSTTQVGLTQALGLGWRETQVMMTKAITQRDFAAAFRQEFRYVEEPVDLPPVSPLLTHFYESVPNCPWEYGCGYWNVFVSFYAIWDMRDDWFALFLEPRSNDLAGSGVVGGPSIKLDWILDALHQDWKANWREPSQHDGVGLITQYARAIEPHARQVFVPDVRPSNGLEGFRWWPNIEARVKQHYGDLEPSPNNSFKPKPLRGSA